MYSTWNVVPLGSGARRDQFDSTGVAVPDSHCIIVTGDLVGPGVVGALELGAWVGGVSVGETESRRMRQRLCGEVHSGHANV